MGVSGSLSEYWHNNVSGIGSRVFSCSYWQERCHSILSQKTSDFRGATATVTKLRVVIERPRLESLQRILNVLGHGYVIQFEHILNHGIDESMTVERHSDIKKTKKNAKHHLGRTK